MPHMIATVDYIGVKTISAVVSIAYGRIATIDAIAEYHIYSNKRRPRLRTFVLIVFAHTTAHVMHVAMARQKGANLRPSRLGMTSNFPS